MPKAQPKTKKQKTKPRKKPMLGFPVPADINDTVRAFVADRSATLSDVGVSALRLFFDLDGLLLAGPWSTSQRRALARLPPDTRIADLITASFPGEAMGNEGANETAIRLLGQIPGLRARVAELERRAPVEFEPEEGEPDYVPPERIVERDAEQPLVEAGDGLDQRARRPAARGGRR